MRNILIFGAGRSSHVLIRYLLGESEKNNFQITVIDHKIDLVNQKVNGHKNGHAIELDIRNDEKRDHLIKESDIVISMLPVRFHLIIAESCLKLKKNLITASYVTPELDKLNEEVSNAGIIFLNECGLDPGIDHM